MAMEPSEVGTNEAAALLAMSRPQVRALMDRGLLESRRVGQHLRIRVSSITAFLDAERRRRGDAMAELAAVENEFGLTERLTSDVGDPSAPAPHDESRGDDRGEAGQNPADQ
jgi:excisionase family DNA binding protein